IGVLGAAANGRVDDEALLRRGVRPGLPSLFKSSFKGSRQPKGIHFSAANRGASFSVGLSDPLKNSEPGWRFTTEQLWEGQEKLVNRFPDLKLHLDPAAGYTALKAVDLRQGDPASRLLADLQHFAIYSPDTATLRGLRTDPQSRIPLGLSGGGLAEAVDKILRQPNAQRAGIPDLQDSVLELIDWANAVGYSPSRDVPVLGSIPQPTQILRFRDRFMADRRNSLSGYDVSEGALYVLLMTVLVHHPDSPRVLAVDNFDHALNPRLARALTRKICEWVSTREDRQLLLTSHNPLVLDGLPLRDENIRLFTVERSYKGRTEVQRVVVDEKLIQAAEDGIPLSQQWVMGTFGGVPNI
ncbi:MAG: ATP-binding protein, partial [Armatimonadota bacterium]|nr:ATP-binding protein [Armatimonadota bacterium]